jgi:hypothetical protein
MSNSKLVYKVLALFSQSTESSLGKSGLEGSFYKHQFFVRIKIILKL